MSLPMLWLWRADFLRFLGAGHGNRHGRLQRRVEAARLLLPRMWLPCGLYVSFLMRPAAACAALTALWGKIHCTKYATTMHQLMGVTPLLTEKIKGEV